MLFLALMSVRGSLATVKTWNVYPPLSRARTATLSSRSFTAPPLPILAALRLPSDKLNLS